MRDQPLVHIEGDTIVDAFCYNVERLGDRPALRWRAGSNWTALSWSGYGQAVAEVAGGLADIGIAAGDRVAILSDNCPQWHLADFGVLASGAVTVPIYQTSPPQQVAYVLDNAEARLCFVDTVQQMEKVLQVRDQLPELQRVVVFDADDKLDHPLATDFAALRAAGRRHLADEPDSLDARAGMIEPEQLATLVYTSGTTGPAKGVMISHANIMWTIRSLVAAVSIEHGERFLSFLPLSHIAERIVSDFASAGIGGETWFARNLGTMGRDLLYCRPTIFVAVPRVWEKVRDSVLHQLHQGPTVPRVLADHYVALGEHMASELAMGSHVPLWEELPHEALDATIGAGIRRRLGLDQVHLAVSAAAPIHDDLLRWRRALGLPLPGTELHIADDGEILIRGGNVCVGYFHDPASTAELIDDNGWMHSGDMGSIDDDWYLRITGRKKDLIVIEAGQNVAPQPIELDLRNSDLISEAVVVGDGRRFLTALVTIDTAALHRWAEAHGKTGPPGTLLADRDLHDAIAHIVDQVNMRRSPVEHVRAFRILDHELEAASGEMTLTGKVKRNGVIEKYQHLVDEMYTKPS